MPANTQPSASSSTPAASSQKARQYDLVLFGATGFTGQLVAHYLAQHPDSESLKLAIAGRSRARLKQLIAQLDRIAPDRQFSLLQADVNDERSIRKLAASARVVITTVGPYLKYGEALARACAEQGTHYADLTGEPEFVDQIESRYHTIAIESGARIVNCCGFDSIPHDLGVFFTMQALARHIDLNTPGLRVNIASFVSAKGAVSGGTWHSAITQFADLWHYRSLRRESQRQRQRQQGSRRLRIAGPRLKYKQRLNAWACTLPTIDPEVVLRSALALPWYGRHFRYGHYALSTSLPKMAAVAGGIGGIVALSQFGPARDALLKAINPGEGPSANERAQNWFQVDIEASAGTIQLKAIVKGGDPGYGETAHMLAETGLCLLLDVPEQAPTGVLTPATAMGPYLLTRLQQAGMSFTLETEST